MVFNEIISNVIPIENVRPFPANSLRKSATNFSLICSFCLKKKGGEGKKTSAMCRVNSGIKRQSKKPKPTLKIPKAPGIRTSVTELHSVITESMLRVFPF